MLRRILAILIPGCLLISGCAWRGYAGELDPPYTDRIIFSPDGQQAAYVWTDRCWSLIPLYIDSLAAAKTELLGWCAADGTNHIVEIDRRAHFGFGGSRSVLCIAFSPDGRHLAAVLEGRIDIVDTATGKVCRLYGPPGKFTSATWFDDKQLVYAMTTSVGQQRRPIVERSIYRRAVDSQESVRLFARKSSRSDYIAFRESWAPGGRTVLLAEANKLWRLDLASGADKLLARAPTLAKTDAGPLRSTPDPNDRPLAKPGEHDYEFEIETNWDINWNPDGEQVSVLARDSVESKLLLAGVFDCKSWRFTDLKAEYCRDVGDKWVMPISWTPDGYLLVRGPKPRAGAVNLIRFSPWEVIDFLGRYGKELPHNASGFEVVQHLSPGWLAIGPGEKDPMMYAVDYGGKKQIPLTENAFAVSGDGRKLAEVVSKGKIVIKALDLPAK
jgi:hypothetical protein